MSPASPARRVERVALVAAGLVALRAMSNAQELDDLALPPLDGEADEGIDGAVSPHDVLKDAGYNDLEGDGSGDQSWLDDSEAGAKAPNGLAIADLASELLDIDSHSVADENDVHTAALSPAEAAMLADEMADDALVSDGLGASVAKDDEPDAAMAYGDDDWMEPEAAPLSDDGAEGPERDAADDPELELGLERDRVSDGQRARVTPHADTRDDRGFADDDDDDNDDEGIAVEDWLDWPRPAGAHGDDRDTRDTRDASDPCDALEERGRDDESVSSSLRHSEPPPGREQAQQAFALCWEDRAWKRVASASDSDSVDQHFGATALEKGEGREDREGRDFGSDDLPLLNSVQSAAFEALQKHATVRALVALPWGDCIAATVPRHHGNDCVLQMVRIRPDGRAAIVAQLELPPQALRDSDSDSDSDSDKITHGHCVQLQWDDDRGCLVVLSACGMHTFEPA